jgi:hypothetical protein
VTLTHAVLFGTGNFVAMVTWRQSFRTLCSSNGRPYANEKKKKKKKIGKQKWLNHIQFYSPALLQIYFISTPTR